MNWVLIIAISGMVTIADIKPIMLTELQCKADVRELIPIKGRVGAVCVGPEGETYSLDNVK